MKRLKNNVTFQFTIGLSLITVLILSIQNQILKLYFLEKVQLTNILLILSIAIIPVIGLYVVTKLCCKKSSDTKHSHLLPKIFIISIILTILATIYLGFKFGLFGNIEEGMCVISKGSIELLNKDIIEASKKIPLKTLILITNFKSILKVLILSSTYICFLILVFVRYWISKEMSLDKEEMIKQIKHLLISVSITIIIEVLSIIGLNIKEGNIPVSMTIRLESTITQSEKQKIENKLKEMDEIINYDYINDNQGSEEFKEWFEETFSNLDYEDYKDLLSYKNWERFDLTVHNKNVDSVKKILDGMSGIKEIQGLGIEF